MELEGRVWKSKKFWLIEVPCLNVMTQGTTRKEALEMVEDAIVELIRSYFKDEVGRGFKVSVIDYEKEIIAVTANDTKLLLAFSLRRQREKSGSTVREAAERLGSKSPNAYAQYERGIIRISLDKYESLLEAANPFDHRHLRIV